MCFERTGLGYFLNCHIIKIDLWALAVMTVFIFCWEQRGTGPFEGGTTVNLLSRDAALNDSGKDESAIQNAVTWLTNYITIQFKTTIGSDIRWLVTFG